VSDDKLYRAIMAGDCLAIASEMRRSCAAHTGPQYGGGMSICADHQCCYLGKRCPACDALKQLDDATEMLREMERTIDRLTDELRDAGIRDNAAEDREMERRADR
jgi:hypothetical protein